MDHTRAKKLVDGVWDESIVPALVDYIRIPNKSPAFEPNWADLGHMDEAFRLAEDWCKAQDIKGLTVETIRLDGRTPLLYMEVPGETEECVLLYGHLDKQPEMVGWNEGLGPWVPVLRDDKLYGRGGADDGYACFASLTAIRALQDQGLPHARLVIIIEGCEESGSYDLPHYIDALADRIGKVDLVICLDSGCGNYDQLWCTTSLRGMVVGELKVEILKEGVHSGGAGGVVPSTFRILRQLLSRIQDEETGRVLLKELGAEIPEQRIEQAKVAAAVLGDEIASSFPFVEGAGAMDQDATELVLNRTWRPAFEITGADGIPSMADGGNVLRPFSTLKLSIRVSPTTDTALAVTALKKALEENPPYGARVTLSSDDGCDGWNAPELAPWLEQALADASQAAFGKPAVHMGEGGTIPFMAMLGDKFPDAQFMITGVLGPASNAHGPNEFLHIPTGKKLTCCVAHVLEQHLVQRRSNS